MTLFQGNANTSIRLDHCKRESATVDLLGIFALDCSQSLIVIRCGRHHPHPKSIISGVHPFKHACLNNAQRWSQKIENIEDETKNEWRHSGAVRCISWAISIWSMSNRSISWQPRLFNCILDCAVVIKFHKQTIGFFSVFSPCARIYLFLELFEHVRLFTGFRKENIVIFKTYFNISLQDSFQDVIRDSIVWRRVSSIQDCRFVRFHHRRIKACVCNSQNPSNTNYNNKFGAYHQFYFYCVFLNAYLPWTLQTVGMYNFQALLSLRLIIFVSKLKFNAATNEIVCPVNIG